MMERNVFRTAMLLGGIITLAMAIGSIFYAPLIEIDESARDSYVLIMGNEPANDEHLTLYESFWFNIEGKSRSKIRHH